MKTTATVILAWMLLSVPSFGQGTCTGNFDEYYLNSNNVRATFYPRGNKFASEGFGGFIVPYPSSSMVSTILASSPWIGGYDDAGNLKVAAEKYASSQYVDFSVGPLTNIGTTYDSICHRYDRVWSVFYEDIIRHRNDYFNDLKIDDTIPSIFGWPATGNAHFASYFGFELPFDNQGLAPFYDLNGNDIYDPEHGDYPAIQFSPSGDIIIPDQLMWMVFNDVDPNDTLYQHRLGFEIQLTAYAFHCQDNPMLNNTVFNSYKVINRSVIAVDSCFFGMWTDYELGCGADDGMGSDSTRHAEFIYNADALDAEFGFICLNGTSTYNVKPPVQSLTYLSHPMHSFISAVSSAEAPEQVYRQLNGQFADGTPITPAGDGYNPGSGLPSTKFHYHGDPRNQTTWTSYDSFPQGNDFRSVSSVSLGRLDPGQFRVVDMAYMFHYDSAVNHLQQLTGMYATLDSVIAMYSADAISCTRIPYCVDDDCVWPGDFNHNGIVDHHDYLTWGVQHGNTGPARNGLITWRGHYSEDWSESTEGVNAKHADADGNGQVNRDDINLHIEHLQFSNSDYVPAATYPLGNDLVLSAMPIDGQGRIRSFAVRAGHELSNVLGISFDVEFDTTLFDRSIAFAFWPVDSLELLFQQVYVPTDIINYACVQTDRSVITVPSESAFVRVPGNGFTIKPGFSIPDSTIIRLRNLKGIDAAGNNLHLGSMPLVVYREGFTAVPEIMDLSPIRIVPNPALDKITLEGADPQAMTIYTMLGQPVLHVETDELSPTVDISSLSPGMYFIHLHDTRQVAKFLRR